MSNCPGAQKRSDNYPDNFFRGPRGPRFVFWVRPLVDAIALSALKSGNTALTIFAPFFCEMKPPLDAMASRIRRRACSSVACRGRGSAGNSFNTASLAIRTFSMSPSPTRRLFSRRQRAAAGCRSKARWLVHASPKRRVRAKAPRPADFQPPRADRRARVRADSRRSGRWAYSQMRWPRHHALRAHFRPTHRKEREVPTPAPVRFYRRPRDQAHPQLCAEPREAPFHRPRRAQAQRARAMAAEHRCTSSAPSSAKRGAIRLLRGTGMARASQSSRSMFLPRARASIAE